MPYHSPTDCACLETGRRFSRAKECLSRPYHILGGDLPSNAEFCLEIGKADVIAAKVTASHRIPILDMHAHITRLTADLRMHTVRDFL